MSSTLRCVWHKGWKDFAFYVPRRGDQFFLLQWLKQARVNLPGQQDVSFVDALRERGYDERTLRFSCRLLTPPTSKKRS